MGKTRSPNYPALSLGEAIGKVRAIYDEDHRSKLSRIVAAKHLGYTGLNGASIGVISALLKYGLLEGRGDEIRVSPSAVALLVDPPGAPDRLAALREAASKPALFADLRKQYDGAVPSADNLEAHLQKQGFTRSAASAASRAYRDTMELVNAETKAHTPISEPKPSGRTEPETPMEGHEETTREALKMRVSKDCVVALAFEGRVTRAAIEKLIAKLELGKDEYPDEE